MWKLLFGLLLLAGLAWAAAFVPIHGRTVEDRWKSARSPADFLERGFDEAKVALGLVKPPVRTAKTAKAAPHAARRAAPAEDLSEKDRAAMDRLVAEHAR